MKVTAKENFKILEDQKNDVADFARFLESNHKQFIEDNVVVDILGYGELTLEQLLNFLKLSNLHRQGGKSFVIANDVINIDAVPEELVVVPTLQEAEDVIQMEEIERDLGF